MLDLYNSKNKAIGCWNDYEQFPILSIYSAAHLSVSSFFLLCFAERNFVGVLKRPRSVRFWASGNARRFHIVLGQWNRVTSSILAFCITKGTRTLGILGCMFSSLSGPCRATIQMSPVQIFFEFIDLRKLRKTFCAWFTKNRFLLFDRSRQSWYRSSFNTVYSSSYHRLLIALLKSSLRVIRREHS